MLRWLARRVAVVALVTVVLAVAALWIEHTIALELPRPTGPLPIGRTSVVWADGLDGWFWYPAAADAPAATYLPEPVRAKWQEARPGFINFLTRDLAKVRGHAAADVSLSTRESSYPIVILRGGGSSSSLNYSAIAEDLASHGYIVVGLDIASTENPEQCDGRPDEDRCAITLMTPLLSGLGRAIDGLQRLAADDPRFRGRLDFSRLGVFGHSFGGAQAAEFCSQDTRCKAGIDIDGRLFGNVIDKGIPVPFMILLSDHGAEVDEVSRRILSRIQATYDRQPRDTRVRATIRGAHHFTFSDDGALLKSRLFRWLLRLFGRLGIDGRRQLEVTRYAVRTFFDRHLRDTSGRPITFATDRFPELVLLR
jgi:dienelactone hydrolase